MAENIRGNTKSANVGTERPVAITLCIRSSKVYCVGERESALPRFTFLSTCVFADPESLAVGSWFRPFVGNCHSIASLLCNLSVTIRRIKFFGAGLASSEDQYD